MGKLPHSRISKGLMCFCVVFKCTVRPTAELRLLWSLRCHPGKQKLRSQRRSYWNPGQRESDRRRESTKNKVMCGSVRQTKERFSFINQLTTSSRFWRFFCPTQLWPSLSTRLHLRARMGCGPTQDCERNGSLFA